MVSVISPEPEPLSPEPEPLAPDGKAISRSFITDSFEHCVFHRLTGYAAPRTSLEKSRFTSKEESAIKAGSDTSSIVMSASSAWTNHVLRINFDNEAPSGAPRLYLSLNHKHLIYASNAANNPPPGGEGAGASFLASARSLALSCSTAAALSLSSERTAPTALVMLPIVSIYPAICDSLAAITFSTPPRSLDRPLSLCWSSTEAWAVEGAATDGAKAAEGARLLKKPPPPFVRPEPLAAALIRGENLPPNGSIAPDTPASVPTIEARSALFNRLCLILTICHFGVFPYNTGNNSVY